jgi:hypothetical protein
LPDATVPVGQQRVCVFALPRFGLMVRVKIAPFGQHLLPMQVSLPSAQQPLGPQVVVPSGHPHTRLVEPTGVWHVFGDGQQVPWQFSPGFLQHWLPAQYSSFLQQVGLFSEPHCCSPGQAATHSHCPGEQRQVSVGRQQQWLQTTTPPPTDRLLQLQTFVRSPSMLEHVSSHVARAVPPVRASALDGRAVGRSTATTAPPISRKALLRGIG